MKKFLAAAAAVTLLGVSAPAMAQSLDGSISYASVDADGVDLGAIRGALSWQSSNFIGLEGELGFGVSDEDLAPGLTAELNTIFGAYVTANADLSENATIFARVGFASADAETNTGIDLGDEGLAYGVGGKFFLDGKNGVRVDYTKYDFDNGDADVWSIGYVRRFN